MWAGEFHLHDDDDDDYYYFFNPRYLFPRARGLKIDENKLKGYDAQSVRSGPAGCRVAEQHWNAVPAPKLADTND